jgi:hypothetical protein
LCVTRSRAPAPIAAARINSDLAEEFFEQRSGLGELRGQVPADFFYGGLGQRQVQKAELTEDQDRVARAGA